MYRALVGNPTTTQNISPAPAQKPKQETPPEHSPAKQAQTSKRPPLKVAVFPMMGPPRNLRTNNSDIKLQNAPPSSEVIVFYFHLFFNSKEKS